MPSSPSLQACPNTSCPSPSRCSLKAIPGGGLRNRLASVIAGLQRLVTQVLSVEGQQIEGIQKGNAILLARAQQLE
jgi:hypothetical protein